MRDTTSLALSAARPGWHRTRSARRCRGPRSWRLRYGRPELHQWSGCTQPADARRLGSRHGSGCALAGAGAPDLVGLEIDLGEGYLDVSLAVAARACDEDHRERAPPLRR